jgi:hypothetical protein
MKITLTSTTKVVELNGVPARIWEGTTESGIAVHAFVTRLAVDKDENQEEFQRELREHAAPSAAMDVYPLRMII